MEWTTSPRHFLRTAAAAMRALAQCGLPVCAAAATGLLAQPGYCADDFPPPIDLPPPIGPQSPPPPADTRSAPPAAEEEAPTALGAPVPYWTYPLDNPSAPKPQRDVQIEQKHVGRRVSEVIVTPAGFTYHYTMTHLDEQEPAGTLLQPHPELSVPRFFRFDF